MILTKIELSNFRNLKDLTFKPSPKLNILVGENGMGKTNFIEALNLLVATKSFKASRDLEMIGWGSEFARVFGQADHNQIEILVRTVGKEIILNNLITRSLDTVGVISGVLFTPSDIEMLTDTPGVRRRFLDILISKINRKYLYDLASYTQVLKNRNRVLFTLKQKQRHSVLSPEDFQGLDIWDEHLVNYGSQILVARFGYVAKLNTLLEEYGRQLLGRELVLRYSSKFESSLSLEEVALKFRELLLRHKQEEIERFSTVFGPHRDDFKLFAMYEEKEIDLGVFGSRGEIRSALLALKISELRLSEAERKDKAILLLYDVLSELDASHQSDLLNSVKLNQTFITTTTLAYFPKEVLSVAKIITAKNGLLDSA